MTRTPGSSDAPTPPQVAHADVLIIGASRGLGLAIAGEYLRRGSRVVATVRGSGAEALQQLAIETGGHVEIERLDTTVVEQVEAVRQRLAPRVFDLLLVSAGVTHEQGLTAADITTEEFTRVMVTNALAPVRLIEAFDGLVAADGTIAVMSSGQGSVARNTGGGWEIYRASKAALNQLMRSYAARHHDDKRAVLLLAPGWVRTEMGGPQAASSIEESVPPLISTVEAQRRRPGLQYIDRHGQPVAW
jgi:NAD(P)-dependent dehydrogenase (short-subunit alcohol dehydrogenase family)